LLAVAQQRVQGHQTREGALQGTSLAWVFFMIFGLSIAGTVAFLTVLGVSFDESLVLALAALTTTGPLVDHAGGIAASFSGHGSAVEVILASAMIVGRLETLAVLAILVPENLRS
jgi:trk system potassium uptake protein